MFFTTWTNIKRFSSVRSRFRFRRQAQAPLFPGVFYMAVGEKNERMVQVSVLRSSLRFICNEGHFSLCGMFAYFLTAGAKRPDARLLYFLELRKLSHISGRSECYFRQLKRGFCIGYTVLNSPPSPPGHRSSCPFKVFWHTRCLYITRWIGP